MTMNILPPAEPGNPNGNMTSGAGRTFGYTSYNKPASISQGATTLQFDHDPEHQRYRQLGPSGMTLYVAGSGVLAEFSGLGTNTQWTNYLVTAAGMIGMHVERSDETIYTRYPRLREGRLPQGPSRLDRGHHRRERRRRGAALPRLSSGRRSRARGTPGASGATPTATTIRPARS